MAALLLAAPLAQSVTLEAPRSTWGGPTPTPQPDVRVVPILAPAPTRKAAGYYRTSKGDVYYFDGCNTCGVGDNGMMLGCTAKACLGPGVIGWREDADDVMPIRALPHYPPGASTLELNHRDMEVISGLAPLWGPTPTPTKKPLPYLTPTPRYGTPTPTAAWPTPTLPPATPTSAAPTRTPPTTATPGPQTPTPGCRGPVMLILRCPKPGLVEWAGGLAVQADGTPWEIVMEAPDGTRTTTNLVTPEMRARQFAEAQRANNEARDLLAGAQSVLREVKRRQEALAPKKKAKKEN